MDKKENLEIVTEKIFGTICLNGYMNNFDIFKLLEMLFHLNYKQIYEDYYINFCFIEKIHLKIQKYNEKLKFYSNPITIYQKLIKYELYNESNVFANYYK